MVVQNVVNMEFKIEEVKAIMMGVQRKYYKFEAADEEKAMEMVDSGDAEDFCYDIDYDIEQTEQIDFKIEEV